MIHNEASQKIYRAVLLYQEDTDPPVINILENSLSGVPLIEYSSTGVYTLTLSQEWKDQKTWLLIGRGYIENLAQIIGRVAGGNQILIQTFLSGIASNDVINECPIEIRVYDTYKNYTQS